MHQNRFSYSIIIVAVITAGILSRKIAFIPLFMGDLLYAMMVYFGICFLFIHLKRIQSTLLALVFCYCIEVLQLYDAEWIIALRNTFFGRYVLGQGFLWSDIIAYSLGIIIAYYSERILIDRNAPI